MEISFCELRAKIVVNILDGKELGNVIDLVIDTCCARVLGIVVPGEKKGFNWFKCNTNIFIPYNRICKIGKDVILVELNNIAPNCCTQNVSKMDIDKTSQTKENLNNNINNYSNFPPNESGNETNYENLYASYYQNENTKK